MVLGRFQSHQACAPAVGPGQFPRTPRSFHILICVVAFMAIAGCAFAQGGPPFYTNDPGTPGPRNWEINLAYMPFLYSDQSITHTPDVDINFGIGERIQLTYENAWLRVHELPVDAKYGLGQSNFGVKWRFYDAGEQAWQVSTYPQVEFNLPGSHAPARGLAEPGTGWLLPVEVMKDFGPFSANADFGLSHRSTGGNEWFGGLAVGRKVGRGCELAAELHGEAGTGFSRTELAVNLGARIDLAEKCTLLGSLGRELRNAGEPRATLLLSLGLQTRY